MKFPHRKEPSTPSAAHPAHISIVRPRIRIRLFYKDRFLAFLAFVDSGADDSMFPLEVAEALDLLLDPPNANRYGGIGSGHITASFTTVTVDAGGVKFRLHVEFSDAPSSPSDLSEFDFRYNARYLADVTCHS